MSETNRLAEEQLIKEEIGNQRYEPLLPVEKKLIGWSLGVGVVLLIVLAFVSHSFPVAPG